ncbi:muskelin [Moniliophthora roreri]|nr:muskelin [Moniliophthora roreri]
MLPQEIDVLGPSRLGACFSVHSGTLILLELKEIPFYMPPTQENFGVFLDPDDWRSTHYCQIALISPDQKHPQ